MLALHVFHNYKSSTHFESLSGILCAGQSMTKRSMYDNQQEDYECAHVLHASRLSSRTDIHFGSRRRLEDAVRPPAA